MPVINVGDAVRHIKSGQVGTVREFIRIDDENIILVFDSEGEALSVGFHISEIELIPHKDSALATIIDSVKEALVPFALVLTAIRSLGDGEEIEIGHTGRYVTAGDFRKLERLYYDIKEIETELES